LPRTAQERRARRPAPRRRQNCRVLTERERETDRTHDDENGPAPPRRSAEARDYKRQSDHPEVKRDEEGGNGPEEIDLRFRRQVQGHEGERDERLEGQDRMEREEVAQCLRLLDAGSA